MNELTDDEKRRVSRALVNARAALRAKMIEPQGPVIVFKAIEDAVVDVERRMKLMTREPPEHLRGAYLQYLHDKDDWIDIVKRCKIDEAAGVPPEIAWGWSLITTPGELEIMEAVEKVFRSCLIGKNKRRDWQIMLRLAGYQKEKKSKPAGGRPTVSNSEHSIAKDFHVSRYRVSEIKKLQCAAIWRRMRDLMPLEPSGRILRAVA